MTRFVHLTDLHLSDPSAEDPHLHSDTPATLDRVIGLIRGIDPPPDFVALSGDLTNHGDVASYRLLKQMLAELPVPVVPALGNHDRRGAYREVFLPVAAEPEAPLFLEAVHGGLHVITLDSSMPGRVGGAIGAAQFGALERALEAHPDVPKLILCHHPPRPAHGAALSWECLNEDDTARLAEVLRGRHVAGVLSGHVHVNRVMHWHGIPVVIGMGLHNTVDVLEPGDMVLEEGAGFALCRVEEDGLDVTFVPVAPLRRVLGRIDEEVLRGFS